MASKLLASLGKQGVKVVIGSRDLEKGNAVAEKLRAEGADATAIRFDITKPADYKEAYNYFDKNFGRLDVLINNAGIAKEPFGQPNNAGSVSPAVLRETFDTNFFGTIELTQALLPLIKKAPEGRIVNLSSILGSLTLQADPNSPDLRVQSSRVRRVEGRSERLHCPPCRRIEGYERQGQLRASWLGENGYGHRRGSHGDSGWSKDERAACATVRRRTNRRVLPHGRSAALVTADQVCGARDGALMPRAAIAICKSFHVSFFCVGSRRR